MPATKGRDFLLKVGTAAAGVTVAAMRTTSFTINGASVDVTSKDSVGSWRELLAGGGVVSASISAAGILTGSVQATDFFTKVANRSLDAYGIVFDNGDKIDGTYQVTSFEAAGTHDGEQTYTIALESSGVLTLTAV